MTTISDFLTANLDRIERERCNTRTITYEPVTIGGRLVQYVGMSGDVDGTYIEVRDPRVDAMTPPGEDVPRITRILTPAERDEFLSLCPLSDRAQEARRWVAGLRAVVEMHRPEPRLLPGGWLPACIECGFSSWPCPTVRAIAGIFRDQRGWDEAWA